MYSCSSVENNINDIIDGISSILGQTAQLLFESKSLIFPLDQDMSSLKYCLLNK
jgi:hypothetical protein